MLLEFLNSKIHRATITASDLNYVGSITIDADILDLFSGSGALALESLSRGAKEAVLCDNNIEAIKIIKKNIEKCHLGENTNVVYSDYKSCLKKINKKFDIIFIDPPYKLDIAIKAIDLIQEYDILKKDGIIIIETDEEERELEELNNNKNINIKDLRRYGRVKLIFLNRKG